jgi:hypothetical protein
MTKFYKNFEEFLIERHAEQYSGLDDEMGEDFGEWIENMEKDEMMIYADIYAIEKQKEQIENDLNKIFPNKS